MKRALVLALPLALAACEQQATAPVEQGGAASGEVLAGSISDAMIPLEQLDSQAPLAPRQVRTVGEDIDAEQPEVTPMEGIEGAPAEGADAAPAAPAPAATE
ncbi:MAG: hypothetical protein NBV68_16145 [Erythrobacter sp.]|uniref:hypothetical protein n=1 Tax=Erythrobacter sp. TaxID=1042 RepID=UPI0025DEA4FA|nr:hypothetical protein [Erythrobacter sp.]MCM0000911.1 hypothetical protein [Erythrobacter sp.]